jgi:uncharacterized membrane protein
MSITLFYNKVRKFYNDQRINKTSKTADKLFWLLIIIFIAIYSFMTLNNHRLFETYGWDLSIFDQGIWQWSHFRFPYSSFHDLPWLADHFHLILILVAPLYWVWSDVRLLIVVQVVVTCLGAVPIYYLSKKVTKDYIFSLILVLGFLTFYSLQWSIFSPFHELAFLPITLGFTLYFWEIKKNKLYWLSFLLTLLVKEEFGFLLAAVGLWELITDHRRWKQAFLSIILGITVSLFEIEILMPFIGGGAYRHLGFGSSGYSIGQVFINVISNPILLIKAFIDSPVKIKTILTAFWPWGFLPIFAPLTMIPVFQQFVIRFLDYGKIVRWQPYVYSLPLSTLMAWASIYAYMNLRKILNLFIKIKSRFYGIVISLILLVLIFVADIVLHEPINSIVKRAFYRKEQWMVDNSNAIKCVPKDVSLSSQNNLAPRLSQRKNIKIFPEGLSSNYDYIIVDLHEGQSENSFYFLGREKTIFIINDLIERHLYKKVCVYNNAMVLERIADTRGKLNYPFEIDIYEK